MSKYKYTIVLISYDEHFHDFHDFNEIRLKYQNILTGYSFSTIHNPDEFFNTSFISWFVRCPKEFPVTCIELTFDDDVTTIVADACVSEFLDIGYEEK
jgi:hypothetical protein